MTPWRSILNASCSTASPSPDSFERMLKAIYRSHPVQGPTAVAKYLETLAYRIPPGKERRFVLTQADAARDDAHVMKRLKNGWSEYQMAPWEVVHHKPTQLARYNSEPIINGPTEYTESARKDARAAR